MTQAELEAQRRVLHRLRRAHGQLAAVIAAVEQDKPCREVVTQLAAVSKALGRAGVLLISGALQECVADPEGAKAEGGLTVGEVEKLFMMLA